MIIWIASYPKSGNTWVRAFLTAYYFTEDGIFDPKKLREIQDYPNSRIIGKIIEKNNIYLYWNKSQEKFIQDKKIRFLKTHNALLSVGKYYFTTPKTTCGILYIVRDPRNVITSLKNHMDLKSYDETFELMKNKNMTLTNKENDYSRTQYVSSWEINYTSWCKMNPFKKLIIKYEDMLRDPEKTFRKIILFINLLSNQEKNIVEKKLRNAILTTNFENMKKSEIDGRFKENVSSPTSKNKINFFHLGPNNNWSKILNKELVNEMNLHYKDSLKDLNYEIN